VQPRRHGAFTDGTDEEVDRMKWIAMALSAVALAVAAGAVALAARDGSRGVRAVVTTLESWPPGAASPASTATPRRPRPEAKRPQRRSAQPTRAGRCRSDEGDDSDPTGDDRSSTRRARLCSSDDGNDNGPDNQAGDTRGDDDGD
jgi:hypothetical protein